MDLSPQQKKFCENYILNGYNATQAYIDAGYKVKNENTASTNASRLLGNAKIKVYISKIETEQRGEFRISKEMILQELAKMAFGNVGHLIDIKNGRIVLRDDLSPEQKRIALASISNVSSSYSDSEKGMSKAFNIQNKDKLKALELIARMTGVLDGSDSNNRDGKPRVSRVLESIRQLKK